MLMLTVLAAVSCSDKGQNGYDPSVQGRVRFEFVSHNVYSIKNLKEIHTVKIWLMDSKGELVELPSLEVSGDENLLATPYVVLGEGDYKVVHYICYDLQADMIEGLDIVLDRDNAFMVEAGEDAGFSLPVSVKQVISISNLYNTLRGICLEILGPDESVWPKSWDFESGEITIEWAGLEFDTDANSNPTDVIGLIIDGEPTYVIDSDTWEQKLVSLVEFKDMTVLPSCVSNLTSLQNIVVRNCALEDLPAELKYSGIQSLSVQNTNLAQIPDDLAEMKGLTDVSFIGNKLTQFPECLTEVSTMEMFVIDGEQIGSVPASIGEWGETLVALSICNTDITELPDVFDRLWHVSMPDFSGNRGLSKLPASIGLETIPYGNGTGYSNNGITGIILNRCGFSSIPEQVQRKGIKGLYMAENCITTVSKADIENMPDLETLVLDGNSLESFPAITNQHLSMLSLIGTGLERSQVDLSGMPQLNPRYVFFTQEEYENVFGPKK